MAIESAWLSVISLGAAGPIGGGKSTPADKHHAALGTLAGPSITNGKPLPRAVMLLTKGAGVRHCGQAHRLWTTPVYRRLYSCGFGRTFHKSDSESTGVFDPL